MRVRRFSKYLISVAIVATAISACQTMSDAPAGNPVSAPSSDPTDCHTVQHEMGDTEICGYPQRVVSVGPAALEALLALGIQPVGFADHFPIHKGSYDQPSQQIPYVGDRITSPIANIGLASSPSLEAILKLQPDLILGDLNNSGQYEALSKMAPALLLEPTELKTYLMTIAQAVDRTEQAEKILIETEQQIASAHKDFSPFVANSPNVLLLSSFDLPELYLGNSAHGLCSSLIEELGFQLVAPPEFEGSDSEPAPISLEALPQLNEADLVIMLGANSRPPDQLNNTDQFKEHQLSDVKKSWQENAIAQSLDASKAGRVYFIPAYLCLGLPGPIGTELYLEKLKAALLPDAP